MFEIWDVTGVARPYDWQSTTPVRPSHATTAFDNDEREPGLPVVVTPRGGGQRRDPYAQAVAEQAPKPQRRRVQIARELMSSPVVHLHPDDTVGEAWELVRERRFRHLPVLDEDGHLVGIVSDRDLLRVAGTPDHQPRAEVSDRPVRTLMHTQVYTARPDAPVRQIARVLIDRRIGAMPVVDPGGALVGMITRTDILRVLVNDAPLQLWV